MNKIICIAIIIIAQSNSLYSQNVNIVFPSNKNWNGKPPIGLNDLGKWPHVEDAIINCNGSYYSYMLYDSPLPGKRTIEVKAVNYEWSKRIVIQSQGFNREMFFDKSGKKAIILFNDSLYIYELGSEKFILIDDVKKVITSAKRDPKYLAYELKKDPGNIIILDLHTFKKSSYKNVSKLLFNKSESSIVIATNSNDTSCLQMLDISTGNILQIWSSPNEQVKDISIDNGNQIAFTVFSTKLQETKLLYCNTNRMRTVVCCNDNEVKLTGYIISGNPKFSENGKYILFDLSKGEIKKVIDSNLAKVDVWSYKDLEIQPRQMANSKITQRFKAIVGLDGTNPYYLIEKGQEELMTNAEMIKGDYIVVKSNPNIYSWWKHCPQPKTFLFDLKKWRIAEFKQLPALMGRISFSPSGKYLIYKNEKDQAFYVLNTENGTVRNLTDTLKGNFKGSRMQGRESIGASSVVAWVNDGSFLINDLRDIWQIDPSNKKPAINLTNGNNSNGEIQFRIINEIINNKILSIQDTLLLSAFNKETKENGLYYCTLGKSNYVKRLCMGPYTIYKTYDQASGSGGLTFVSRFAPRKASCSDSWIFIRQSDQDAPNVFITRNFVDLKRCSNLRPHDEFNWLKVKVINYKTKAGEKGQALLYIPENFDSTKKYPVIFHYYERFTHRAYEFIYPEFMRAEIDIPWFVSNGYLVCTPDIFANTSFASGIVLGEYALDHVVSAASFLKHFSFIDSKRMGIQGHSFGGFQTNYLATHTDIFAAVMSASGTTDLVSAYLGLVPFRRSGEEDYSKMDLYENENGNLALGASLWEKPEFYIRQSPVLDADKVSSPILIMHNKGDEQVNFRQGIEFYMALRRLSKPSWLLQYDDGGHAVFSKNDILDFTIRMTQFFNHYLMGAPAPKWMTQGIPATLKGVQSGFDLDLPGVIP